MPCLKLSSSSTLWALKSTPNALRTCTVFHEKPHCGCEGTPFMYNTTLDSSKCALIRLLMSPPGAAFSTLEKSECEPLQKNLLLAIRAAERKAISSLLASSKHSNSTKIGRAISQIIQETTLNAGVFEQSTYLQVVYSTGFYFEIERLISYLAKIRIQIYLFS